MPNPFKPDGSEGRLVPVTVVKDVTYVGIKDVWGFSFDETGTAPVEMVLRDGGSGGDVHAYVNIAADKTVNMSYVKPLYFPNGLHIVLITGAFQGVVYL